MIHNLILNLNEKKGEKNVKLLNSRSDLENHLSFQF